MRRIARGGESSHFEPSRATCLSSRPSLPITDYITLSYKVQSNQPINRPRPPRYQRIERKKTPSPFPPPPPLLSSNPTPKQNTPPLPASFPHPNPPLPIPASVSLRSSPSLVHPPKSKTPTEPEPKREGGCVESIYIFVPNSEMRGDISGGCGWVVGMLEWGVGLKGFERGVGFVVGL